MMINTNTSSSPIFVMGTGRCGLTPLMDVLAYHKDLAWPSQYLNRPYLTNKLYLAYLSRIADWRIFNTSKKHTSYFFLNTLRLQFYTILVLMDLTA